MSEKKIVKRINGWTERGDEYGIEGEKVTLKMIVVTVSFLILWIEFTKSGKFPQKT